MKKTITWILVADGNAARLFQNEGPGKGIAPVFDGEFVGTKKEGKDLLADAPGRSFDSAGQGRHRMEPETDPRRVEEEKFLRRISSLLEDAANKGEFERLVVVAPPRALGELRGILPSTVSRRIKGEVHKDLVHATTDDLLSHLGEVMPV